MEFFDEAEGAVGVLTGLHVDTDKVSTRSGRFHQGGDIGEAEVPVKVDAKLRQLEGDVAVDLIVEDGAKSPEIDVAALCGFADGVYVFAEVVEGCGDAFGVDAAADLEGFVQGVARHESMSEAMGDGGSLHPSPQPLLTGEEQQELA